MHFIATYLPVLMLCAFSTSLKVPSPFFEMSRYSDYLLLYIVNYYQRFAAFQLKKGGLEASAQWAVGLLLLEDRLR